MSQRKSYWQPCDLLAQCGVAPAGSTATPDPQALTINYLGLPAGCVLHFEVVAVDTAGNRSGQLTSSASRRYFADNSLPTTSANPVTSVGFGAGKDFTIRDDEIYYPTCGATLGSPYYVPGLGIFCPSGVTPPGYYRCGAPC